MQKQFDVIHAVSAQRGELMQGITGIPWYYRQFGYEMALDFEANRILDGVHIPTRKKDNPKPADCVREAQMITRLFGRYTNIQPIATTLPALVQRQYGNMNSRGARKEAEPSLNGQS